MLEKVWICLFAYCLGTAQNDLCLLSISPIFPKSIPTHRANHQSHFAGVTANARRSQKGIAKLRGLRANLMFATMLLLACKWKLAPNLKCQSSGPQWWVSWQWVIELNAHLFGTFSKSRQQTLILHTSNWLIQNYNYWWANLPYLEAWLLRWSNPLHVEDKKILQGWIGNNYGDLLHKAENNCAPLLGSPCQN